MRCLLYNVVIISDEQWGLQGHSTVVSVGTQRISEKGVGPDILVRAKIWGIHMPLRETFSCLQSFVCRPYKRVGFRTPRTSAWICPCWLLHSKLILLFFVTHSCPLTNRPSH